MKIIFFCLVLLSSPALHAGLYKYVNSEGETVYSDQAPDDNTKEIKLPPLQTTAAIKVPAKKPQRDEEPSDNEADTDYRLFKISQPASNTTLRNNSGDVQISVKIKPSLNISAGDRITYKLDGKSIKKGSRFNKILIKNVARGEHSFKAQIRNKQGKLLKSTASIKFNLLRYSRLHKKAP